MPQGRGSLDKVVLGQVKSLQPPATPEGWHPQMASLGGGMNWGTCCPLTGELLSLVRIPLLYRACPRLSFAVPIIIINQCDFMETNFPTSQGGLYGPVFCPLPKDSSCWVEGPELALAQVLGVASLDHVWYPLAAELGSKGLAARHQACAGPW